MDGGLVTAENTLRTAGLVCAYRCLYKETEAWKAVPALPEAGGFGERIHSRLSQGQVVTPRYP